VPDQLARLVAPPPPDARLANPFCDCRGQNGAASPAQGFAKFDYTLIPITEEAMHAGDPI